MRPSAKLVLRWVRAQVLRCLRRLCWDPDREGGDESSTTDMDLAQPATPISFPLTSLEKLLDGTLFKSFHFPFLKSSVPLPNQKKQISGRSKLLVCHDLKGGYQDDRFVQGDGNDKAYSLWHWQCVDIFVYFSHSLVTIPPPCWINAGHLHGVKVLGTLITEWDQGAQTCKELLSSKDSARMYAEKLAEIASELGFDGWLLNIESKVAQNQIDTLIDFVKHLTDTMHELVPGSEVIWYDAVTTAGNLDWQDLLNQKNKPFFDVCDGIFINYTWKADYPRKSAKEAGNRAVDVYMGVDVFGRNTFGGGGYQTDVALRASLEAGVSAALFAPGWVYETGQGPTFEDAQNRFWASIHSVWPVALAYPASLPFFTDFSQGFGRVTFMDGTQISSLPWSNLSCQGLQPLMSSTSDPTFQVTVRSEDEIYSGGSSLRFYGELEEGQACISKLYNANVLLTSCAPIFIGFAAYSKPNCKFSLVLRLLEPDGQISFVFLDSSGLKSVQPSNGSFTPKDSKFGSETDKGWILQEHSFQVATEGTSLTSISGVSYFQDIDREKLSQVMLSQTAAAPGQALHRKTLRTSAKTEYEFHLGYLRVTNAPVDDGCATVTALEADDVAWTTSSGGDKYLSLRLTWKLAEVEDAGRCSRYNIYAEQVDDGGGEGAVQYLGAAFVKAFYVDSLAILQGTKDVILHVQARSLSGTQQRDVQQTPGLRIKSE